MSDSHDHVRLLAGYGKDGKAAHELTPARRVGEDEWLIVGTPGLANGCAAGDRVRVDASGAFAIVERGRNVAVHFYASRAMAEADLLDLRAAFEELSAQVEWPAQRRFAVATVPVGAGFQAIEHVVSSWIEFHPEVEWNYGNVYDGQGHPLGWWE